MSISSDASRNEQVPNQISRRRFLSLTGGAAGVIALGGISIILPGCGQANSAPATTTATAKPATTATSASHVPQGMVDTERYKKPGPWTVGRAGAGDVNAWMVMLSATYNYAIKDKYKTLFKN